jgi:hypothetical protein
MMNKQKMNFYTLEHTSRISVRSYVQRFPFQQFQEGGKIFSEGAYRIGLAYGVETGSTNRPIITLNGGESFTLSSLFVSTDAIDPFSILWLEGEPALVRDDILEFTWLNSDNATLYVFFDRVQWKRDNIYYPAQAADKMILARLTQEGVKDE